MVTDARLRGLTGRKHGTESRSRKPIRRGCSERGAGLTLEEERAIRGISRKTTTRPGAAGMEQEREVGQEEVGGWGQGSRLDITTSWALVGLQFTLR